MARVIYKYELIRACATVEHFDALFGVTRSYERVFELPVDAAVLAVNADWTAFGTHGTVGEIPPIVMWCAVDPSPAVPRDLWRVWCVCTGGPWPERRHIGTVSLDAIQGVRVVHFFAGMK